MLKPGVFILTDFNTKDFEALLDHLILILLLTLHRHDLDASLGLLTQPAAVRVPPVHVDHAERPPFLPRFSVLANVEGDHVICPQLLLLHEPVPTPREHEAVAAAPVAVPELP